MEQDFREQACWLLLTYESGLSARIINDIVVAWCHQSKRPLQEFFATSPREWIDTCHLSDDIIKKLEKAKENMVWQAFLVKQFANDQVHFLTLLDASYPKLLKLALKPHQTPPGLSYAADLLS